MVRAYDAAAAHRRARTAEHRARVRALSRGFRGKCSPVHFFWGSFDLAITRFNWRGAPPRRGPSVIDRDAYDEECISLGFWPGDAWNALGDPVIDATFYSYASPAPEGWRTSACARARVRRYSRRLKEFVLPYESVRRAPTPRWRPEFAQSVAKPMPVRASGSWDTGAPCVSLRRAAPDGAWRGFGPPPRGSEGVRSPGCPGRRKAGLPFERLGEYDGAGAHLGGGMASVWSPAAPPRHAEHLRRAEGDPGGARAGTRSSWRCSSTRRASRAYCRNSTSSRSMAWATTASVTSSRWRCCEGGRCSKLVGARRTRRKRPLGYEVVAWIGARVADALHHAHDLRDDRGRPLQVIHRDVSPSNIFLTERRRAEAHLLPGLAKARDRMRFSDRRSACSLRASFRISRRSRCSVSPADRRADIFALGRDALGGVARPAALPRARATSRRCAACATPNVPDPTTVLADYPPALAEALAGALPLLIPAARFQTAAGVCATRSTRSFSDCGAPVDERRWPQALAAETVRRRHARPSWEKLIDAAADHPDRIRVWDATTARR